MNEDVIFGFLQRVPLFAALPAGDLRVAARQARAITRKKGVTIFDEGSPADSCYVITSGRAKVVLAGSGATEVILNTVEPLELVGELSLLDGSPRSAGLVALEECQLLRLPKAAFHQLRSNRQFEDRLIAHVAAMLRRSTEQVRAICTYNSKELISWGLARLAVHQGRRDGDWIVIAPKPSDEALAAMLGCQRETVNRVLSDFRKKRWVVIAQGLLTLSVAAFEMYLDIARATNGVDTTRVV